MSVKVQHFIEDVFMDFVASSLEIFNPRHQEVLDDKEKVRARCCLLERLLQCAKSDSSKSESEPKSECSEVF